MAIKSKSRGKGRSAKQVTRGPRFQPKPLPTPWYRTRRFQVIGAFCAGIGLVLLVLWVRAELRDSSADEEAETRAAALRTSAQEFANAVDPVVGEIGTPTGASIDPFPRLPQDLEAFQEGRADVADVEASASATADVTGDSIPKLRAIDVPAIFGDRGLDATDVTLAVHARDRMLHALQVYDEAAAQALRAAAASGTEQRDLAAGAIALTTVARAEFVGGYADYVELQQSAGVFQPPMPAGGQIPGGLPPEALPPPG